ncbi:epigen-like [Anoplopoma fimbria]|uniref:epigen-like n=1 Tax=Anoplopoma fimbria TaxID=229290 RepID=UPI0023EB1DB0|nr:epigen-like [Anoplopoma fimbria]
MFTQRQMYAENALLTAMAALLLLTTTGQSAMLTTATPALSDSSMTTQLINSSMEKPQVRHLYRSCRSEHEQFCNNGGECMYPQDSDKPHCICQSSYTGHRCMFLKSKASYPHQVQLIPICLGIAMLIVVLVATIYCLAYKRCIKSASLKKISNI